MSDLYDDDILLWSEQQAALLRRVAAGERVNEADLDWPNVIEEVESVGRSELRAVESLLRQSLLHLLKARAWPNSSAKPGWEEEARRFRFEAQDTYSPSMRQRIDIAQLYAQAIRRVPAATDGAPAMPLPPTCFVTLDDMLDPAVEVS